MRKLFCLLSFALMISCSTIKFIGNPTTTKLIDYNKKEPLAEYEKKFWHLMDPLRDSVAGRNRKALWILSKSDFGTCGY